MSKLGAISPPVAAPNSRRGWASSYCASAKWHRRRSGDWRRRTFTEIEETLKVQPEIDRPVRTGVIEDLPNGSHSSDGGPPSGSKHRGLYWLAAVLILGAYFVYSAFMEERYMAGRFPDSYPEYRRSTKMLIPFLF